MESNAPAWLGWAAALGSGLLVGIERERRKGTGQRRALAGVRTFSLVALAGAGAQSLAQGAATPIESIRLPILAAFTANSASKLVAAFIGGGFAHGWRVGIGLLLAVAASWVSLLFVA